MTAEQPRQTPRSCDVHDQYRRWLKRPTLADRDIEEMRKYLVRLVQTICEHVWGKRFH